MDDTHVGRGIVTAKCEEAIVGSEEFVSIFARLGIGEGEYHEDGDSSKGGQAIADILPRERDASVQGAKQGA